MDEPSVTTDILAFLARICIPIEAARLGQDTLLPAMTVRHGVLMVDLERLRFPGDLLHEAGHIAVTDPALRSTLEAIGQDPGEEIAAIAWSYAAAVAIGLDPAIVFHDEGYRGGGAHLAAIFASGCYPGLPLLQWYGMALDAHKAAAQDTAPYPHMQRWLR